MQKDYSEGFRNGYYQIPKRDEQALLEDLKEALCVTTLMSIRSYRDGKRELRASQIIAVEQVFKKYNITDVWGRK